MVLIQSDQETYGRTQNSYLFIAYNYKNEHDLIQHNNIFKVKNKRNNNDSQIYHHQYDVLYYYQLRAYNTCNYILAPRLIVWTFVQVMGSCRPITFPTSNSEIISCTTQFFTDMSHLFPTPIGSHIQRVWPQTLILR